jgi:hypothetical protein
MVQPVSSRVNGAMMVIMTILLAACLHHEAAGALQYDTLGGPLPTLVRARATPYYVVSDIEVPAGKVVTIEPGAVFLFKNFTGLHVQGRLIAEGTKSSPIVFTSEYDQDHNRASRMLANPFDWNGIYVHDDALGTSLTHCEILFSVYGLISETKFIRLKPVTFRENGKSSLVIEKREHTIVGDSYTYELSTKDAMVDGVPVKILRDPLALRRNAFRYTGLTTFLSGCGFGVYEYLQYRRAKERQNALSSKEFENLRYHDSDEWQSANRNRIAALSLSATGFALGFMGVAGITYSFTF